MKVTLRYKGGSGSGNFAHAGRPGMVGGSADSDFDANGNDRMFAPGKPAYAGDRPEGMMMPGEFEAGTRADQEETARRREQAVRKYDVKYEASYISSDKFGKLLQEVGTKANMPSQAIVYTSRKKLNDDTSFAGMKSKRTFVVPKSGMFAGVPMKIVGYATMEGGKVTHWEAIPVSKTGKVMGSWIDSLRLSAEEIFS